MSKKIALFCVFIILILTSGLFIFKLHQKNKTQSLPIVRVGLNPWIGNGLFYFAQDEGIFKKNGVELKLIEYDDNSVGKQLISSNQIDVLPFTPDVLVDLKAAGADVKCVALSDNSKGADGIVATDKIKSISDLKNKTIAFESGSTSQLLLAQVLAKANLTLSDITPLNMPAGDAGAAFLAGKVDIAVTWEPWLTKDSTRPGGHILASSQDLDVLPNMMIFQTSFAKDHRDTVLRFEKSFFEAVALAKANPAKIQATLGTQYSLSPQETAAMMNKFSWFDLNGNLQKLIGEHSSAKNLTETANAVWLAQGIISNPANLSEVWDDSIITELSHEKN